MLLTQTTVAPAPTKRHLDVVDCSKAKKSHFACLLAKNLEAQKQQSLLNIESFKSQLLSDRRTVAPKTLKEWERLTDA